MTNCGGISENLFFLVKPKARYLFNIVGCRTVVTLCNIIRASFRICGNTR